MSKINNLKTIFSRKEQILLREAMAQTEELNKKTRTKSNTKSEKKIETKSKKNKKLTTWYSRYYNNEFYNTESNRCL